jgi:hypothetical protein
VVGEVIMITGRTFLNFLNCQRKAFLQTAGNSGDQPDIERVQLDLEALYRRRALEALLSTFEPFDVVVDPTSWTAIKGSPSLKGGSERAIPSCAANHGQSLEAISRWLNPARRGRPVLIRFERSGFELAYTAPILDAHPERTMLPRRCSRRC